MNDADVGLPNDVPLCHELIRQQAESLDKAQRRIEQEKRAYEIAVASCASRVPAGQYLRSYPDSRSKRDVDNRHDRLVATLLGT